MANLARPGGNITGLTFMAPELGGKRLELLKEAVPRMALLAVLSHPGNPSEATLKSLLAETESAARVAGVQLQRHEAKGPDDLDKAFGAMSRARVDGLILLPSAMFSSERRRIADLAEGLPHDLDQEDELSQTGFSTLAAGFYCPTCRPVGGVEAAATRSLVS